MSSAIMRTADRVRAAAITWNGCSWYIRRTRGRPGSRRRSRPPPISNAARYSIHFHVWTQSDLLELMLHCRILLGSFEIEAVRRSGLENIVVLRKNGELVVKASAAGAAPPHETRLVEARNASWLKHRLDGDRARAEAGVLGQRVKDGEQVLNDVFNSASWRLMKPLRSAKHAVARLRP